MHHLGAPSTDSIRSYFPRNLREHLYYTLPPIVRGGSEAVRRDAAKLMAQIPPDTRDLTAQLCGDPLPERSALAMRVR